MDTCKLCSSKGGENWVCVSIYQDVLGLFGTKFRISKNRILSMGEVAGISTAAGQNPGSPIQILMRLEPVIQDLNRL